MKRDQSKRAFAAICFETTDLFDVWTHSKRERARPEPQTITYTLFHGILSIKMQHKTQRVCGDGL